jgi:hypothetical protein
VRARSPQLAPRAALARAGRAGVRPAEGGSIGPDLSPSLDPTEARIDQLLDHLPSEWSPEVQRVRGHMASLLGSLEEFERELQESVA